MREVHISGAEGIFGKSGIAGAARGYIERAMAHSRGEPDRIVITIEKVGVKPIVIRSLPVSTLKCGSAREARKFISALLDYAGVSEMALKSAFGIVTGKTVMRGASLIWERSGRRVEPDQERGIRVSRLGISSSAGKALSSRLAREGIDTATVREALILASKVASCLDVRAELCISDDPDYTTGYVASREYGYVRIPNIKRSGTRRGGRVFFLREGIGCERVIEFLEDTPVLVNAVGPCGGACTVDEILDRHNI